MDIYFLYKSHSWQTRSCHSLCSFCATLVSPTPASPAPPPRAEPPPHPPANDLFALSYTPVQDETGQYRKEYEVKWFTYSDENNTWEPEVRHQSAHIALTAATSMCFNTAAALLAPTGQL